MDSDTPSKRPKGTVKSMTLGQPHQRSPFKPNGQGMFRLMGEHPNGRENSPTVAHSTQRPTVTRGGWVECDGTDGYESNPTTMYMHAVVSAKSSLSGETTPRLCG